MMDTGADRGRRYLSLKGGNEEEVADRVAHTHAYKRRAEPSRGKQNKGYWRRRNNVRSWRAIIGPRASDKSAWKVSVQLPSRPLRLPKDSLALYR
jgi:hypothetical protein